ncbi:MAG: DUF927 domain-containing protein, partial [Chloroflexi bacterium]|nr:DUF927 domain-containing protein [Chloroflexota bacterium]
SPDTNSTDSLIASWDMTVVGFERRASAMSCMPMIVDDSKRAKAYRGESTVPGIVYAIANGSGRARGSVKGMQRTSYWRTVMLSTGEQRLIDFDKSGGTPARVVTLWANPFGASSPTIADAIKNMKRGLMANHGHAGPALVRWLIFNRERWPEIQEEYQTRWTQIRGRMMDDTRHKSMDMAVLDRIAGNLAVMDVTAQVAHMAMDLPWEQEGLIDKVLPIVTQAAKTVDRELEALRMAVSWAAQNRGKFAINEKHRNEHEPTSGWLGYWEASADDGWDILAFFPGAIRKFLDDQGFEPYAVIRQWHEAGWLRGSEADRASSRVAQLGGKPRMIVLRRDTVEGPGGLSAGAAAENGQEEIPF